jgi:hypothetical protein
LHVSIAVDASESAGPFGEQLPAAVDLVFMVYPRSACALGVDRYPQLVAEPRGLPVGAGDFVDDQDDSVPLQVDVLMPNRPQMLDTGDLEVLEVVCVMHDALGVGFVVADFECEFVISGHGGVVVGGQLLDVSGQLSGKA